MQAPFHVRLGTGESETLFLRLDEEAEAVARAFALRHAPWVGPALQARLARGVAARQLELARGVIEGLDRGARAAVSEWVRFWVGRVVFVVGVMVGGSVTYIPFYTRIHTHGTHS